VSSCSMSNVTVAMCAFDRSELPVMIAVQPATQGVLHQNMVFLA
jgi:hypothetical protein